MALNKSKNRRKATPDDEAIYRNQGGEWSQKLDAIACGVRARLEDSTGLTRRIIKETVEIARAMGLDESEVTRWANARDNYISSENTRFSSLVSHLNAGSLTARDKSSN